MRTSTVSLALALVLTLATSSMLLASDRPSQQFATGGMFAGDFVIHDITDPLNGSPDTNAFDGTQSCNIQFVMVFDFIAEDLIAQLPNGHSQRILTTGPARVVFLGDRNDCLQVMLAKALNGPIRFSIHVDSDGLATLEGFDFSAASALHDFGFQCVSTEPRDASPSLASVSLDDGTVFLRRFATPFGLTDLATGTIRYALSENSPVAVEAKTFSAIKAMYRGN